MLQTLEASIKSRFPVVKQLFTEVAARRRAGAVDSMGRETSADPAQFHYRHSGAKPESSF
ncbi:MAG: hypothetical protein M3N38_05390 [Pseudomonadota bacterium]|nr:hypothetical protein [Pseudomonadota bacterium]